MLGWNIFINRQNGEKVASWSADIGGFRWLDALLEAGKAVCLQDGFYPSRYRVQAKDILPVIAVAPPCVKIGLDWISRTESKPHVYFGKSEQALAACPPEEWLTVEVWDLS